MWLGLLLLLAVSVCAPVASARSVPAQTYGQPLIDLALGYQQAFIELNVTKALSFLSADAILLIDGMWISGVENITVYLSAVFSSLSSLNEALIGLPVMTNEFVAWEKELTATTKNGTVVRRTEIEWLEFDSTTLLLVSVTSIYNNSTPTTPAPTLTDPRIAAALLFQQFSSQMNATMLGSLFAPNGIANVPIGVAATVGRAAITSSFSTYFATLTSQDEAIVGDGIILADSLNTVAFTKVITATMINGTVMKRFVVNWFTFAVQSNASALPLIQAFSAAFNLSSSFPYSIAPPAAFPLPACLTAALSGFNGSVCLSGSVCYNATLVLDNERLIAHPLIVLWPASNTDVALALRAAQKCSLTFSVRGGGHSAVGYCLTPGGITIDMRLFNTTTFGAHDYTVGAGLTWSHVYAAAVSSNISAVIGGTCASVGVGGFTLGGGVSRLSRTYAFPVDSPVRRLEFALLEGVVAALMRYSRFGLAVDNLLNVTAVLANGSMVVSSASDNADLWWALRGGGGGNFAVITSLSYRIPPLPSPMVALISALWPASAFPALMPLYARWAAALPNTSCAYLLFTPTYASLQYVDFTNNLPALQEAFAAFNCSIPDAYNVSISSVAFLPWEINAAAATNVDGRFAYVISEFFNSSSLSTVASILTVAILKPPTSFCEVIFGHVGGVVNSVSSDATAFPYRDMDFLLEIKAIWPSNDTAMGAEAMAWAVAVRQSVYALVGSAPYVNYMDPGLPVSDYYGANFARLRSIKQQVDPRDVFRFPMGIPLSLRG